ncbi:hypothetical protein ACKWTF_010218 [Chironomus riparius]
MNSGGKNAILEVNSELLYQHSLKNFTNFQICREYFMTVPIVIYTNKNFYLLQAINDKIEKLIAAGLIEYWHSLSYKKELLNHRPKPPKVLTFNHLSGSFYILIFGCSVACLALVFELITYKFKLKIKPV